MLRREACSRKCSNAGSNDAIHHPPEMRSEADIIARLARAIPSRKGAANSGDVRLGIGDDAAVIRAARGRDWVVSTDALLEGRHFLERLHAPAAVGYKALARAVSDLAAMGATPRYFLLTLALPRTKAGKWLDEFAAGMAGAARLFRMQLIGGDVARDEHVAAAVTVIGEAPQQGALQRSGGRPGDALYVTGRLGAAQAGLERLRRTGRRARREESYSLDRHLHPVPRLAIGAWLAEHRLASAAMDISDGLSTDLPRLCEASGVGAVIHAGALAAGSDERRVARRTTAARGRAAELRRALHGGEDYELLFSVPRRLEPRIPRAFRGVPMTRIGELTAGRAILLEENGRTRALRAGGWEHFARG